MASYEIDVVKEPLLFAEIGLNIMPNSVPIVRDVPPIELTECLKWLLPSVPAQRALWIVSQLTDRVAKQKTSIYAVESRHLDKVQGAAIAILLPPSAATLLAFHQADGDSGVVSKNGPSPGSAIMDRLQARLRTVGVRFLQISAEDQEPGPKFQRLGFQWIADLVFLVLEQEPLSRVTESESTDACVFRVVGDNPELQKMACDIACQSFADTKDCPKLSEFRSAEEIVSGYTASATFDPSLWRVLFFEGKPAACLFLTAHNAPAQAPSPSSDATGVRPTNRSSADAPSQSKKRPSGQIEISYMGVAPKYRGIGLGKRILAEAASIARQRDAERMILAVDRQNEPAVCLYERHGWVQAAGESVWGLNISP